MDFGSVFMVLASFGSMSAAIFSTNLVFFARLHDWNVNFQQCPIRYRGIIPNALLCKVLCILKMTSSCLYLEKVDTASKIE